MFYIYWVATKDEINEAREIADLSFLDRRLSPQGMGT